MTKSKSLTEAEQGFLRGFAAAAVILANGVTVEQAWKVAELRYRSDSLGYLAGLTAGYREAFGTSFGF